MALTGTGTMLREPVLDAQAWYVREIDNVVGYQRQTVGERGAGDKQIRLRRGPTLVEQHGANLAERSGHVMVHGHY